MSMPEWGNNAQLAARIGMHDTETFFDWKGVHLGVCQEMDLSLAGLTVCSWKRPCMAPCICVPLAATMLAG